MGESALGFGVDVFLYVFCFVGDCRAACTLGFVWTFFAFPWPEFVLLFDFFYELLVGYFYGAVCEVSYWDWVFHCAEAIAAVEFVVESQAHHVGAGSAVVLVFHTAFGFVVAHV